jgi:hypothetical protein
MGSGWGRDGGDGLIVAKTYEEWAQAQRPEQAWRLRLGDESNEEGGATLGNEDGKEVTGMGHMTYLWGMGVYMLFSDLEREKPLLLRRS